MCKSDPRQFFLLIFFLLSLLPVFGQQPEDGRIFKMAWDMPSYADDYACARKFLWSDPNSLVDMYVMFSKTRNVNKGDEETFAGYVSFRPIALDFKDFSLAFGVSYTGSMADLNERDDVTHEDLDIADVGEPPKMRPGTISAQNVEGYSVQNAISFSTLASFPRHGLQIVMDVGYAWTKIKVDADLNARVRYSTDDPTFSFEDRIDDYTYLQANNGVYLALEIRKFFDRNYLNYFNLMIYGIQKIETDRRRSYGNVTGQFVWTETGQPIPGTADVLGRVDLPVMMYVPPRWPPSFLTHKLPDPQEGDFNGSFVGGTMLTRLVAFPMDIGDLLQHQEIALDAMGGFEHTAGELLGSDFHGIGINVGGQLSLFDIVSVVFTYTFQRNNDLEDEWDVTLVLGLH